MTFDQWWYDYKIKNGLSGEAVAKQEVARHAWAAATIAAARPEGATIPVPTETLKKWRKELDYYWFATDGEGGEYNNDGVIETCREIDALLPQKERT
jgi:hypothetical protein